MTMWRVSSGTAAVLGLRRTKATDLPTTAYLMLGEGCLRDCAFCAQARSSKAGAGYLSRVTWQSYDSEIVVKAALQAFTSGKIKQVCLQIVERPDSREQVLTALKLFTAVKVPVVVSGYVKGVQEAEEIFAAGASRLGLALDVASPTLYARLKGGSYAERLRLIKECAALFPERITTHVIVGLGETEAELLSVLKELSASKVRVGLFAFTPIKGTVLAHVAPPDRRLYRRVQAARYLLQLGVEPCEISISNAGYITFDAKYLEMLRTGEAFRTSGCLGCNRPYYNERPGEVPYNYARKLSEEEAIRGLRGEG